MATTDLRLISDALELEHRQIDERLQQCLRDADAGRASLPFFAEAAKTLRRHIYVEEEMLFPDLEAHGMVGPIVVMVQEHGEVWWFLDQIEDLLRTGAGAAGLSEAIRGLRTLLEEHNLKEEHVVYPCADRILLPDDPATLMRQLQETDLPPGWVCRARRMAGDGTTGKV